MCACLHQATNFGVRLTAQIHKNYMDELQRLLDGWANLMIEQLLLDIEIND